jgi:predicted GIY-YIG superfamily endonuclease
MPRAQRFVYIIRSEKHPDRYYTGLTAHVKSRLADHKQRALPTHGKRQTVENRRRHRIRRSEARPGVRALPEVGSGCAFAARRFR